MIVDNKGLPFEVKIPTKEFKISIYESENRDGKSFKTTENLFINVDT